MVIDITQQGIIVLGNNSGHQECDDEDNKGSKG